MSKHSCLVSVPFECPGPFVCVCGSVSSTKPPRCDAGLRGPFSSDTIIEKNTCGVILFFEHHKALKVTIFLAFIWSSDI